MEKTIIEASEYTMDFNHWLNMRNTYDIKRIGDCKPPKTLIKQSLLWFKEFCELYHIDYEAYPYLRVTLDDPTWQIDFHTDEDEFGPHFSLYQIYFDGRSRTIMRADWAV